MESKTVQQFPLWTPGQDYIPYRRDLEISLFQEVRPGWQIIMSLAQEFNVPTGHCNGNLLFILAKHILPLHSSPVLETCLSSLHMGLKQSSFIQGTFPVARMNQLGGNIFLEWVTKSPCLQLLIWNTESKIGPSLNVWNWEYVNLVTGSCHIPTGGLKDTIS